MDVMRRTPPVTAVLAVGVCGAALLAGCGSQTKTVTVASTPPAPQSTATTSKAGATTPTSTATPPASTTPAQSAPGGGTAAPGATRTAPEPAFTHEATGGGEGVSAAAAVVRAKGFTPENTSEYHANQTLRVLIGTRTGSGDGYGQQAFFFLGNRYIGTDAKEPSATVKVLSQSDTEVTLAYPLYRKGDSLASPSGGQATVTFALNNGQLTPLGAIPPASSTNGLSRN
jgi:LppP/LprE lipoprotein